MIYDALRSLLPRSIARYVMHFEASIDDAVSNFAGALPPAVRVLDAGAGETAHKHYFSAQQYCGLDLGIGDHAWDYSQLDVLGNLETLPFPDATFAAAINIVTLEHVVHPDRVICELGRVLAPGGRFLLVAPLQWEEHQQPHDYGRFTRFALDRLLKQAGFTEISIQPVGGIFRLISRRLLNALQFFPGPLMLVAAVFFAPPALVLPLLDPLDKDRSFTLGYICSARKPS
ncbi:MAG: methyltransferase domain-containing protein [Acidobacteriia bacterium]|nr:methyltransferase domain-containing protein [Terriglobia bacterium]